MRRVAVTGAGGFVGRYVVAELERRGMSATLVCRPGAAPREHLRRHHVVQFDITMPPANAYELMGRPDVLIHLAWGGLPNYRSLHHFERELPAHYAFLKSQIAAGVPRCVVTGTCFEYGMQSGALHERMEPRPANAYGFAKDTLRRQLEYLRADMPFTLVWARLFYLFGDGQASGSLWSLLNAAVRAGRDEFPMSGGEQLRDYLPVEQAAAHLVALAAGDGDPGVINVCSGEPVSVRRLVERWIAERGWSIVPVLGQYPYPDYEPMAFWGDAAKLRMVLSAAEAAPRMSS